jgi:aspartyl-tRNA(Asn)/glutamyl-tRNA(Gln) amidotransferase subunit C
MAEQNIDLDQVSHVAKLARLGLTQPQLEKLAGQLGNILSYVEKLSGMDTAGVEPMSHALPLKNVLRDDIVQPSLSIEQVLQNAPEAEGRFFKVPKVIDGEENSAD